MVSIEIANSIRKYLYSVTGIRLGDNKDIMISNRLDKMIKNISYKKDVVNLVKEILNGNHKQDFINAFTTNKTNFFREDFHFDDLRDRVFPELFEDKNQKKVKIYCSASSTGEEPYSIAVTALESKEYYNYSGQIELLATDIDTEVLNTAKEGMYEFYPDKSDFPPWLNPSRFFKKKDVDYIDDGFLIKAKDEVKRIITFRELNLMGNSFPFEEKEFDVIFCRNVLIYFSQDDQRKILANLFKYLKIGGTLYLGHSEGPLNLLDYVTRLGHNVFVKMGDIN